MSIVFFTVTFLDFIRLLSAVNRRLSACIAF